MQAGQAASRSQTSQPCAAPTPSCDTFRSSALPVPVAQHSRKTTYQALTIAQQHQSPLKIPHSTPSHATLPTILHLHLTPRIPCQDRHRPPPRTIGTNRPTQPKPPPPCASEKRGSHVGGAPSCGSPSDITCPPHFPHPASS
ncbi:hypothetical protein EJ06DRAFT_529754 [Trichodelitschia bisporula]|uniref:Uncharacterized protein n=1 Tax=Trichodelitschia bisporula TaxID=703511 RepID=A0A6G1HY04_9PEZI|nr:hypothetical protein EJ06DRAFT_529754 [Trichodelitschia bisporula]